MEHSNLSKQDFELTITPTNQFSGLKNLFIQILEESDTELEFISKIREKIKELRQFERSHISLFDEELMITNKNYDSFFATLNKLKENLVSFNPSKIRGILKSEKKGNTYSHLYEYYYDYLEYLEAQGYVFQIWEEGRYNLGHFSYQLRVMENGNDLKVTDLYADAKHYYNGKGISIAMILESKRLFSKRIISSSNKKRTYPGENNSEDAVEKVWEPLVKMGLAKYNTDLDHYYIE